MQIGNSPYLPFKLMSPSDVSLNIRLTSGIYVFFWIWMQSRSSQTPLDNRLKWSANLLAICGILYFFAFFKALISVANSRSEDGMNFPAVWPFLCLAALIFLFLCLCVAFITQKLNNVSANKISVLKMVLLTLSFFISLPKLQARINEIYSNVS